MILLSAWVSARRLSQCSRHQVITAAATRGACPPKPAGGWCRRQGIVQPLAILDPGIGGVRAKDEGKHALQLAVDKVEEQPVGINVLFQQLLRREMISHWVGLPESAIACRARA